MAWGVWQLSEFAMLWIAEEMARSHGLLVGAAHWETRNEVRALIRHISTRETLKKWQ